MTPPDPTTRGRHVAVGHSRISAATHFGTGHDDLVVTSYDDFHELDLDEVTSLHLVVGDGPDAAFEAAFEAAFDAACRRLHTSDALTLGLAVSAAGLDAMAHLLDRGGLQIEAVDGGSEQLSVRVGPRGRPRADEDALVLSALNAVSRPAERAPLTHEAPPSVPDIAPSPPPGRTTPPRPRPRLVSVWAALNRRLTGRASRRTKVVAVVVLLAAVVAVALLASTRPELAAVLVALVLALLATLVGLSCLLVLQLARQVHAQTGRLEKMVLRNRKVVENRTIALGRRIRTLEADQARLPFAYDYLEAVAEASASSSARLTDLLQSLESSGFDPDAHVDLHSNLHLQTQRHVFAQLQLVRLLDLPGRVPPLGGWAASPDFGLLVVQELLRVRPAVAVELGSGATTLLMALAIRQHSLPTRLVALEHRADFKERTEALLADNGVDDLVDVRLAPLGPSSLPDHPTRWYDESALAGLEEIGLVVVDGPPSYTGSRARYPAVPLLAPHFAEQVSILADDTIRDDDLEVVGAWSQQLPEFEVDLLDTLEKHAALLRRR